MLDKYKGDSDNIKPHSLFYLDEIIKILGDEANNNRDFAYWLLDLKKELKEILSYGEIDFDVIYTDIVTFLSHQEITELAYIQEEDSFEKNHIDSYIRELKEQIDTLLEQQFRLMERLRYGKKTPEEKLQLRRNILGLIKIVKTIQDEQMRMSSMLAEAKNMKHMK